MRLLILSLALAFTSPSLAQTRYEWTGGDGNWSEPTNWSPTGVPAAPDTAVVGGATTTVVTLTANTTVAGLEVAGSGAIGGNVDLTVTDRLLWRTATRGFDTIRGTGTLTVGPNAVLRLPEDAGGFRVGTGRVLLNQGLLIWEAPTDWNGLGRLINEGEIDLAFDATGDVTVAFHSAPDAITNTASGVIRRTGTGNVRYIAGLVNDGLIRVETGSLDLLGFNATGTTGSGSIEVEAGAALRVSSGIHTQASVSGEALTFVGGGRLTVTDGYDVTTTRFVSGNGRLVLNSDGATETLVMATGTLDGSGTLTVTGSMTWTGGTMEGTGTTVLGPAIPLTIGGNNQVSLSGTRGLRTEGPVTWTGDADISSGTGTTVFENAGTLTSSGPGERLSFFVTLRNTGTLVHDGGTLRFTNSPMANEGVVRIEDGLLSLNSDGTDTGRYEIAETGRMEFISGTRTLSESAEVVGTGTVAFAGGAVVNRATWRPGTSPGTLTVDSDLPAPSPEAVLDIELGGPTPGTDFDQLEISGAATLGGTLRVSLTDGFTPQLGDRFQVISAAGGATGAFDALDLPDGLEAFVETSATGAELVIGTPVSTEPGEALPEVLALHAPAPNPTRFASSMQVDLPAAARARLAIYDALGREVAVALDGERPAGRHVVALVVDGLAAGVYVVRLVASGELATQRLTVVR